MVETQAKTMNHPPKKKPRRVRGEAYKSPTINIDLCWSTPGCYNCSQRRINCDRGTPECQKCIKKGLECHGLGTRYRFQNGVASRGELAGKKIPVRDAAVAPLDKTASCLDIMDSRSRFLLRYCEWGSQSAVMNCKEVMLSEGIVSDKVGPAMVALTIICNGYRDFILPLSEEDGVVRNAVMAAAARHLALHHSEWNAPAFKYHMAAIQGLVQRADRDDDLEGSIAYSNLSTMVVLLIEEMITGMKDYRILLRMVQSFVKSQGEAKVGKRPLGRFLMQEIRK